MKLINSTNPKVHQVFSLIATILVLLLLIPPIGSASDDSLVIRVGVYDNPPKIFLDDDGKVNGFYADLIEAIAKREGWAVQYVFGSWEEGLNRTERGDLDLMVDVAYSKDRAKHFAFNNETIFVNWGVVYSAVGQNIQSFTDLDKKRIATMRGSIHTNGANGIISLAKSFDLDIEIILVDDYTKVFESLQNGSADVGVVNRIFGEAYSKDYPVEKTTILFDPSQLRFAFPKNGEHTQFLIERIDEDLQDMKANQNSEYYAALTKHISGFVGFVETVPTWLYVALASSAIIILLLTVGAIIFRKQRNLINKSQKLLEVDRDKLQKANKLKDLFIDIMRHDLLNPIGSLRLKVDLAMRTEKNPQNKKILKEAFETSSVIIDRINEAALLSKLVESEDTLKFTKINLRKIVNTAIKETSQLAKEKKIKIVSRIKEDIVVNSTPLIYDVFLNLITNAIKYGPIGGDVIIGSHITGNRCRISVADLGKGISDEYKKSIFQRFLRLEKGGIVGSGLGLAITQKIVDLHKGKIWVEDNPAGGSIFIVELPQ